MKEINLSTSTLLPVDKSFEQLWSEVIIVVFFFKNMFAKKEIMLTLPGTHVLAVVWLVFHQTQSITIHQEKFQQVRYTSGIYGE